jgi:hypothetical protein
MSEEIIRASWQPQLMEFKKKRAKYLLYPEKPVAELLVIKSPDQ